MEAVVYLSIEASVCVVGFDLQELEKNKRQTDGQKETKKQIQSFSQTLSKTTLRIRSFACSELHLVHWKIKISSKH